MQKEKQLVPKLRFPVFKNSKYNNYDFKNIFIFSTGKNIKQSEASTEFKIPCVRYGELYHMYNEVIYEVINRTNLNKSELIFSEGNEILLPSAGEDPLDIGSASSLSFKNIAIGRTINILRPKIEDIYYQNYVAYYISNKLRQKISTLAKGSSISNVYNSDLKKLEIILPNLLEQKKVANFISTIDKQIQTLEKKKTLLEQYKKGVLQNIFKQELRFKDDDGNAFPKWEKRKFADVLFEHKLKSTGKEEVHSVSVHKGVINQIEHLGRSFSAKDTSHYSRALPNDIIYTKSPTGDFPLGIIKQNHIKEDVIISPLYGVFTPETKELGYILHVYFESPINVSNYLSSIIQKGAKNTINITNTTFLSKKMLLPVSKDEQIKIANFLSAIDTNIALVNTKIEQTKSYKKGLLQQMFV